jgi:hypothetical protein
VIDGRLGEPAWKAARPIVLGKVKAPGETSPRTEVRFLHKDGVLYVGAALDEPEVGKLRRKVTGHDGPAYADDSVELFLSPHPVEGYFQLIFGAGGGIYDRRDREDPAGWNAGAKAAVAVGERGWFLEVAIPMAKLEVGPKPPVRWRANVYRNRQAGGAGQNQAWSPTFRTDYDVPARFGFLSFAPKPPVRVEPKEAEGPPGGIRVEKVDEGASVLHFDLGGVAGRKIHRAELTGRRKSLAEAKEQVPVDVEVAPLRGPYRKDAQMPPTGEPLRLIGPWFRSFDATALVGAWLRDPKANHGVLVRGFSQLIPASVGLHVEYEGGSAADRPPQVTGLRVFHRAGQTFITWRELEDPFGTRAVTLGELRKARRRMDAARRVRYRVYRHDRPIGPETLAGARLLAEVEPLSGYNLRGVSVDRLIHQHQLRALRDSEFARSIARGPFNGYHSKMAQMSEVIVSRLAVEDGRPLPPGTGLYVHHPSAPAKAYYAVATVADGTVNTTDFPPGATLAKPVAEQVGRGRPVFQGVEDLKVFYDYPGRRRRYVQWCAPPLANLPNECQNWSVYVPPAAGGGKPLALGIYFHDWRGLYLRPRWPHRGDMILICPQEAPRPTFGYGYHEALDTLRPVATGAIRDYTARRIDAFIEWLTKTFSIDQHRMSCHGMGVYGGTAALQYGLRHPERFALIVAGSFDANPARTPAMIQIGRYTRQSHLKALEAVWGRKQWDLKTAGGVSIWKDRDLVAFVRRSRKRSLPFLSLGTGSQHSTWPQENALLKALWQCGQPFWTDFTWGGQPPRFGPLYVRRDRLMLAASPDEAALARAPWYKGARWQKAAMGYWGGGEINTGVRWQIDNILDTPDRLEVTGRGGGNISLRNTQAFRLKPGEKVRWRVETGRRDPPSGEATADENGVLTIRGLYLRGRMIVTRITAGKNRQKGTNQ